MRLRVLPSAHKHGCTVEAIGHALDMALAEFMLDADHDPPKRLFIGPDPAGNIIEVIGGEIGTAVLIWHAMPCRRSYLDYLAKHQST